MKSKNEKIPRETLEKENQEMKKLMYQNSLKKGLKEPEEYRYQNLLALQNLKEMIEEKGLQIAKELNQIAIQIEDLKNGKLKGSEKNSENIVEQPTDKKKKKKEKKVEEDDDDDDDDYDDDEDDDEEDDDDEDDEEL